MMFRITSIIWPILNFDVLTFVSIDDDKSMFCMKIMELGTEGRKFVFNMQSRSCAYVLVVFCNYVLNVWNAVSFVIKCQRKPPPSHINSYIEGMTTAIDGGNTFLIQTMCVR